MDVIDIKKNEEEIKFSHNLIHRNDNDDIVKCYKTNNAYTDI